MVKLLDKDVPTPVVVGAALAAPLVLRAGSKLLSGAPRVVQNGKFKGQPLPADVYDAVIVGAGPSGSTCAHFFAKASAAERSGDAAARHGSPQTARLALRLRFASARGFRASIVAPIVSSAPLTPPRVRRAARSRCWTRRPSHATSTAVRVVLRAALASLHLTRACVSGDAVCTPAIRILTEMGVMQARPPFFAHLCTHI